MDSDQIRDEELVARLRRLEAGSVPAAPGFDYSGLLARNAAGVTRARRRLAMARGTAGALVVAFIVAGLWRFDHPGGEPQRPIAEAPRHAEPAQPRIVRADTYLALVALEDHIASLDDAINVARLRESDSAEIERLERTRAELLASYVQVRYAERVSANF